MKNILKMVFIGVLMLAAAMTISAGDVIFQNGDFNITGDLFVDTSTLFVDTTNNKIGIGTTDPSTIMDIETAGADALTIRSNYGHIIFNETDTNRIWKIEAQDSILKFRDETNTANRMIIDSDGKIGIGTTFPSKFVDIKAPTNEDALIIRANFGHIILNETDTNRVWKIEAQGSVLKFRDETGTKDRIIIDTAGEVGFQCTDPDHDLTIGGTGSGCNTGTYSELDAGESTFTTSSSRDWKENLVSLDSTAILDKLQNTTVYNYNFKRSIYDENVTKADERASKLRIGVMAEDFYDSFQPYTNRGERESLNGDDVMYVMWLSLQELIKENEALKDRVEVLEGR